MLEDFGYCIICSSRGALTKEGYCPTCRWKDASMTYDQAYQKGTIAQLEAEGYLPVSGWDNRGRLVLYGYVHPARSREGWQELFSSAWEERVTNMRLGTPQDVLFGRPDENQLNETP